MGASSAATIPSLIFLTVLFLVVRFALTLIRRFSRVASRFRTVLECLDPEAGRPLLWGQRPEGK
jgi:hypothetical protein